MGYWDFHFIGRRTEWEALDAACQNVQVAQENPFRITESVITWLQEMPGSTEGEYWLALCFDGFVLPIQGRELVSHLRDVRLAYDNYKPVPDAAMTINARIGQTRAGKACLQSVSKADTQEGLLCMVKAWYREPLSAFDGVTQLAIGRSGTVHLLFVAAGSEIEVAGERITYDELLNMSDPDLLCRG